MAEDPVHVRCCCCGIVKNYDNPNSWRGLCVMTAAFALGSYARVQELARQLGNEQFGFDVSKKPVRIPKVCSSCAAVCGAAKKVAKKVSRSPSFSLTGKKSSAVLPPSAYGANGGNYTIVVNGWPLVSLS